MADFWKLGIQLHINKGMEKKKLINYIYDNN